MRQGPIIFALAAAALLYSVAMPSPAATPADTSLRDALAPGLLGLYSTERFKLASGHCRDCPAPRQALWYFNDEMIAVAKADAVGYAPRLRAQDDVKDWLAQTGAQPQDRPPPLVWIGSPHVAEGRLSEAVPQRQAVTSAASHAGGVAISGGATRGGPAMPHDGLLLQGSGLPREASLTPRLASNRAYFDASSLAFFAGQTIKARGVLSDNRFVIRTLWPQRYDIPVAAPAMPLAKDETIETLVRAAQGGAKSDYAVRTLWRRDGATQPLPLAGKPILAFVLNGAQGDDDEAYGGHFAIANGRFGPRGQWDDWLVNNFYSLASISEKGIIAATLPMDAYMGDLNSGQSWYRPSYMLVAVLKDERAPALYQEAISRVFNHFYRQDFAYRHASSNCAGISVNTLRSLGWNLPKLGGEAPVKAALALPYMAVKEGSLSSGQSAYDYLKTERTELFPFAAFSVIGQDLLARLPVPERVAGALETQLGKDLEALLFVRIPQFPSSRVFGSDPVLSLREYQQRTPPDRADWQIVPVPPRVLPAAFRDAAAPKERRPPSVTATWVWAGVAAAIVAAGALLLRRRRASRQSRPSGHQ